MHRILRIPVVLTALVPACLPGSGTRVDYIDAFATGRGNAFSATADNPSAVYYNPAGITQLDSVQMHASGFFISLDYEAEIGGQNFAMDDGFQLVPSFFVTTPLGFGEADAWYAGLGVYAPFGLATDWPDDSPFFAVADRSELVYLALHPVLAYRVNEQLSLGGGPTVHFAELEFEQHLTGFFFEGDDTSVGWVFSVLYEPGPRHAFAFLYRSEAESAFSGNLDLPVAPGTVLSSPATADFTFPDSWRVGYSFRPTPQWNLEVNVEWMNWEVLDTVILQNDISPVPFVFNWDSSFFYEFGGTRYFDSGWMLSAGWVYVENSVPDETFTPIVPDSNRRFYSLGAGFEGAAWAFHAVFQLGEGDRRVPSPFPQGAAPPQGQNSFGTYQTDSLAFNISLSYKFQ